MEQQLRFRTAERTDHISSLLREKEYVKRNSWPASPTGTICKYPGPMTQPTHHQRTVEQGRRDLQNSAGVSTCRLGRHVHSRL
jgi:hypothetical protein